MPLNAPATFVSLFARSVRRSFSPPDFFALLSVAVEVEDRGLLTGLDAIPLDTVSNRFDWLAKILWRRASDFFRICSGVNAMMTVLVRVIRAVVWSFQYVITRLYLYLSAVYPALSL